MIIFKCSKKQVSEYILACVPLVPGNEHCETFFSEILVSPILIRGALAALRALQECVRQAMSMQIRIDAALLVKCLGLSFQVSLGEGMGLETIALWQYQCINLAAPQDACSVQCRFDSGIPLLFWR